MYLKFISFLFLLNQVKRPMGLPTWAVLKHIVNIAKR